ncbi:hypothetical protein LTR48_004154 [Friedmanniomyces endolithicus]|nr:hypothetical protein LTR29_016660 [Friedmanniomyces endolithicus]KAK1092548.1 hypothetical protein LTR48_004154 [Friedmanniomyces endolithicus]
MRRDQGYEFDVAGTHHPATETTETYFSSVLETVSAAVHAAESVKATDVLVKPADVLTAITIAIMMAGRNNFVLKHLDDDDECELQ